MDIGGVVCVAIIGLLVGMLAGAALLRTAVSIANRVIGPAKAKRETIDRVPDWDWDDEPEDPRPRRRAKPAVPKLGIGKGMMIASAANVVNVFVVFVLGAIAEEVIDLEGPAAIVLTLLVLPFAFAALTLLLTVMLPTTLLRAALVAFLYHALAVFLLLVVEGGVFVAVQILDG